MVRHKFHGRVDQEVLPKSLSVRRQIPRNVYDYTRPDSGKSPLPAQLTPFQMIPCNVSRLGHPAVGILPERDD